MKKTETIELYRDPKHPMLFDDAGKSAAVHITKNFKNIARVTLTIEREVKSPGERLREAMSASFDSNPMWGQLSRREREKYENAAIALGIKEGE